MRTYKMAAIGGDGIGPEVVEAGVQVLKVCAERDGGFTLDVQDFKWGSESLHLSPGRGLDSNFQYAGAVNLIVALCEPASVSSRAHVGRLDAIGRRAVQSPVVCDKGRYR